MQNQVDKRTAVIAMSAENTTDAESAADPPEVEESSSQKEEQWGFRKNKYALFVVLFVLMIRMTHQWQRKSLTYAFGFAMPDGFPMEERSIYEISASYPQLNKLYGVLAGLAYTLPYSISGLVMGSLTGVVNRKIVLGCAVMISGLSQFLTGKFDSFTTLCAMRGLHGAANSATNPLTYSLVSDYVPPQKRATANSILSSAIYVGVSLSSLSILMIKSQGWRWAYQFMGAFGVCLGLSTLLFLKEP